MISVENALKLVLENTISPKTELVNFQTSLGRVLAEDLVADRDFPPFDRVTMDGIAIDFSALVAGQKNFKIQEMQAAGDEQKTLDSHENCIEIMTGAVLPKNSNTVIRYEDLEIENGFATILAEIKPHQNVHFQGQDKLSGQVLVREGQVINASHVAIAASIGKHLLGVRALPKIAIASSGDELVGISEVPLPHQIRLSNVYAIASILKKVSAAVDIFHINDTLDGSVSKIEELLKKYDVLIFSGGVSMGKKDFIPQALAENNVKELFHKIAQKPGKPMWFGKSDTTIVFALPGNPVSTYLCTIKYVLPWLKKNLGILEEKNPSVILTEDIVFKPKLNYFLQVKIENDNGCLYATPLKHHGSGDFISLAEADGFIELPFRESGLFLKGEIVDFFAI
ncbi:molybdopterin molybdenumtransferase MoeA [Lacihabitans sp. CCS-44]|uniref:molybdopterin molybdotransferase MoeA n=1 Tax=Lacihabitans sp. CCS-44 TaxID=2487331 RepID=UPI0020CECB21|nr:molybdopterin molybdotransferase MoeA [Lacihabitans sp. CCS-44]MCP9756730.1 molybdopterin molybdenumtransferase MoeA [Lacihabitans sp. CCS-44]